MSIYSHSKKLPAAPAPAEEMTPIKTAPEPAPEPVQRTRSKAPKVETPAAADEAPVVTETDK